MENLADFYGGSIFLTESSILSDFYGSVFRENRVLSYLGPNFNGGGAIMAVQEAVIKNMSNCLFELNKSPSKY